ncbi:hypothetical protein GCM10007147_22120 [Nocardiopsis kunsanensis]|uniref:Regulator of SigK n=1 Tax=Nocardiopsis kunsanensis TaxID=141693 RepID=A0A918XC14_9ACTN|nr:anti-sigma factor [Nocardiopsis kunsanensis]GHD25164.1 hypothetical protein GCM10007147_22120 [Nocardiopsis kunsanensis]
MKKSLSQDQHTLSGAYALDALPPEESVRFEDHLAECDACVQEVRGFSETTARLASAAASPPPEELRSAVMAEISRTRQLAPPPARMPEPPRRWGWGTILALAACLVLLLSLSTVVLDQARQVQELRENERRIAAVLSAPDAVTASAEADEDVSAAVVSSPSTGEIVFSARGLEELHDEDYQLWLTRDDGSVYSAGVLDVEDDGGVAPVPASAEEPGTEGVAVTVEPEGGSEQPTTDPMMAIPLEEGAGQD